MKTTTKFLNVSERVEVVERKEDGLLPSPAILLNVNVRDRKP